MTNDERLAYALNNILQYQAQPYGVKNPKLLSEAVRYLMQILAIHEYHAKSEEYWKNKNKNI